MVRIASTVVGRITRPGNSADALKRHFFVLVPHTFLLHTLFSGVTHARPTSLRFNGGVILSCEDAGRQEIVNTCKASRARRWRCPLTTRNSTIRTSRRSFRDTPIWLTSSRCCNQHRNETSAESLCQPTTKTSVWQPSHLLMNLCIHWLPYWLGVYTTTTSKAPPREWFYLWFSFTVW